MRRFLNISGILAASSYASYSSLNWKNKNVSAYVRSTLPTYTMEDVSKHSSNETGYWVAYKNGVYDITNFINKHIGGPKYIELVSGGYLEPFWSEFDFHKTELDALKMLESYKIGNLHPKDQIKQSNPNNNIIEDVFKNEPKRDKNFILVHEHPFVGEISNDLLGDNIYTPNNWFYIRNHFPVPIDNEKQHNLHIHLTGLFN